MGGGAQHKAVLIDKAPPVTGYIKWCRPDVEVLYTHKHCLSALKHLYSSSLLSMGWDGKKCTDQRTTKTTLFFHLRCQMQSSSLRPVYHPKYAFERFSYSAEHTDSIDSGSMRVRRIHYWMANTLCGTHITLTAYVTYTFSCWARESTPISRTSLVFFGSLGNMTPPVLPV